MAEAKPVPVAVVVGVGPGLGAALARRFAQGVIVHEVDSSRITS
jgi:NAD(P)-dependent dehydrogenase (short-subunit alcohol dehydrogenase family)